MATITDKKTTPDIVRLLHVAESTATKWARDNDLEYIQVGKKKYRLWSQEDIEHFKERAKPGRRW
jgi:predicted site-specific integrase-resolvase